MARLIYRISKENQINHSIQHVINEDTAHAVISKKCTETIHVTHLNRQLIPILYRLSHIQNHIFRIRNGLT